MSLRLFNWLGEWRHLVEHPLPIEEVEKAVDRGSIPAYSFYFMLACSALIATFGLLANSAAVIIGAMIVAPLMSPIISLSYGIVAGKGTLTIRSVLTIVTGTLLTIGIAYLFTRAIGWNLAGSEIVARMRPSLLDLGVAVAAGAAAVFAYSRPNITSALAGVAIAVALVPPLCTVGISLGLGDGASVEVGLAMDSLRPRGPFLLYLTNIIGIVLAGALVFFWRYHRHRLSAILALVMIFGSLVIVVPPLGISMDNLLVRNQIHRSLVYESRALLPESHNLRFTNLSVQIRKGTVFVRGDLVTSSGLFSQDLVEELRNKLVDKVKMPVSLEFGIITETILRSSDKSPSDG